MVYNLEEQERIAELKAWWQRYGIRIVAAITFVLLIFAAWQGWKIWRTQQIAKASALYSQLQQFAKNNEPEKFAAALKALTQDFSNTTYAPMASLQAARFYTEAKDLNQAKVQLEWVLKNTKLIEIKAIAAYRLAGVLLDLKQYDEALKALNFAAPASFKSLYADRRGDIFVAQAKVAEAMKEYRLALDELNKPNSEATGLRSLVEIKLDALGQN